MMQYAHSGLWLVVRIPEEPGTPAIYWSGISEVRGMPSVSIDPNDAIQFYSGQQADLYVKMFLHPVYHKRVTIESIEWP